MKKTNLKYYLDARLTTKVRVIPSKKTFEHKDARRSIVGLVNHLKFPFPIQQIKIIDFSNKAVKDKLVVGNHGHPIGSQQWEIVLALGDRKKKYFKFRYKNRNDKKIYEKEFYGGDVAIIPPGCILAFVPLSKEARLIEISNKEYRPHNYIKDSLF